MQRKPASIPVVLWLTSGILLIMAMVIIGGITRLTGSGLSLLFPSSMVPYVSWGNVLHNGVAVQFLHRWSAVVVLTGIVLFTAYIRSQALTHTLRSAVRLLLIVSFLQVALGIATLVLAVPIVLGVLHQVVAVLLFMRTLFVAHQLQDQTSITVREASSKHFIEFSGRLR